MRHHTQIVYIVVVTFDFNLFFTGRDPYMHTQYNDSIELDRTLCITKNISEKINHHPQHGLLTTATQSAFRILITLPCIRRVPAVCCNACALWLIMHDRHIIIAAAVKKTSFVILISHTHSRMSYFLIVYDSRFLRSRTHGSFSLPPLNYTSLSHMGTEYFIPKHNKTMRE